LVKISVRHNDHVVLGAAERLATFSIHGGRLVNMASHGRGTDKAYGGNIRMRKEGIDCCFIALNDIKDAIRQAGIFEPLGE
jgi:hypothetical protein